MTVTLTSLERGLFRDLLLDADRAFWIRRAEAFAQVGNPRCDEIAQACMNRALLEDDLRLEQYRADVVAVLDEPADTAPTPTRRTRRAA